DERIVGIDIATRPDCINTEVIELLKTYKNKLDVTVELGLQTANDDIARLINRGYDLNTFTKAVTILNEAGIYVVVHIMIGLPNETKKDIEKTVKYINTLNINGIKIHSTYIVKGTLLEKWYQDGKYEPITLDYYLENLLYVITHINKN